MKKVDVKKRSIELSGRRFTQTQLYELRQTVTSCTHLSRTELAYTLCENLSWKSANGKLKVDACLKALDTLAAQGVIELPAKRAYKKRSNQIRWTNATDAQTGVQGDLKQLGLIRLQRITESAQRTLWNEWIDRYHYLGYQPPFGSPIRYFIVSETTGLKLGCLLFTSAAWAIEGRDRWIGWDDVAKKKHLNLVVNQSRFLLFPWIKIKNLASHVLSIASRQIGHDWLQLYGTHPVLLESFVDRSKYSGTSYQAANWVDVGMTKGRGRNDQNRTAHKSLKIIYVYALDPHFRTILSASTHTEVSKKTPEQSCQVSDDFVHLWGKIAHLVTTTAHEYDQQWQKRKRVIDTLLIILLLFHLVLSHASTGYLTIISRLWKNCQQLGIRLPQDNPIAASSFSEARAKLHEGIFQTLNKKILAAYASGTQTDYQWLGHNVFAVDGTKMNLPPTLAQQGYRKPHPQAHYPQGLVSCLYQLKSRIPYDFDLNNHENERISAEKHLRCLHQGDLVVYDRGYYAYALLYAHLQTGIHAVFRLKTDYTFIKPFLNTPAEETVVQVPPPDRQGKTLTDSPEIKTCQALPLRLIKYTIEDNTYYLGTTLMDSCCPAVLFKELYHARWGIEELYKISKTFIDVEDFHAKSERGVKQELYAHFVLITLGRLFSNKAEIELFDESQPSNVIGNEAHQFRVNFKSCLQTLMNTMEELFFITSHHLKKTILSVQETIARNRYKNRNGRAYQRRSFKPVGKWTRTSKQSKGIKKKEGNAITSCAQASR